MRVQLREYPSEQELNELYGQPYDHRRWPDHIVRIGVTCSIASIFCTPGGTIADLSCGDAVIAGHLARATNASQVILGDITPGRELTGPIEKTIEELAPGSVDMFVLSETLEHVADPDALLAQVRKVAHRMVLSTPDGEMPGTVNREHVWGWDAVGKDGVGDMLAAAGWAPMVMPTLLDLKPAIPAAYCYQIWVVG